MRQPESTVTGGVFGVAIDLYYPSCGEEMGNKSSELRFAGFCRATAEPFDVSKLLEELDVADRTHAATPAIQRGIVHLD
jgi:hypothetical protein